MKKKLVGDMTLKDFKKHCDKTDDCSKCRFLNICGIPFGALTKKQLKEDSDYENN